MGIPNNNIIKQKLIQWLSVNDIKTIYTPLIIGVLIFLLWKSKRAIYQRSRLFNYKRK